MALVILLCGIVFLFVSIIVFKLHGFLALMLTSILVGLLQGMEPLKVVSSIEAGLGGTLGHLGVIIGFGAIFGKLLSESGGAQKIAMTLVGKFGQKNVGWAISITSLLLGITLFWEVGFVLLIPITFTVAVAANVSIVQVGIPMLASIGVTHAFLPPHPGPTAVAGIFGADIGLVIIYGLILAVPIAIIAGPLYAKLFKSVNPTIPEHLVSTKMLPEEELPGFATSVLTALSPIIIIFAGMIAAMLLPEGSTAAIIFAFIGNADIALLLAVFIALYVFGIKKRRRTMKELMSTVTSALVGVGGIMFIIGAGGSFKQVILDSGMADYIGSLMGTWDISPYLLAFLITAIIRLAVGSATVTVITSSAIVLPLLATGVNPELMVLILGSASGFAGPPNDASFWMIKEFFNLSMSQTVKIWCGMCTLTPILGLGGVMILSLFV